MKRLRLLLILAFVCARSQSAAAQKTDWVNVPLENERLTIRMPQSREEKKSALSFARFKLEGRIYTASSKGVNYSVWSLVDKGKEYVTPPVDHAYLDNCAELIWESLLKPRRDQIPKDSKRDTHMHYEREFARGSLPHGREYSISLEDRRGLTRFYVAGRQIYILLALNQDADSDAAKRFFNSFAPKAPELTAATLGTDPKPLPPSASVGTRQGIGSGEDPGIGPGPGRGGPAGSGNIGGGDRTLQGSSSLYRPGIGTVFNGKEVTAKARVLTKPEPQYTEGARKFAVTGTVILRVIFNSAGEVVNIKVVRGLPHGLTERAIAAARNIKFTPAQKDGEPVSMWYQLEYNYNLY